MAQARLGPGRIHHCMRSIGAAERALQMLCLRAKTRVAFGGPLADKGVVQETIANSRIEIDQARLLTLHAAWLMDTVGNKESRGAISAIKVAVPMMASRVIDRAMQVHGAAGLSQDLSAGRRLRIATLPPVGRWPGRSAPRRRGQTGLRKYRDV
jgi:acyl-CoA dehydrogenase